jgi:hypothetical protein
MTIGQDEALQSAFVSWSTMMKHRLEIVDSIPGTYYGNFDLSMFWIIHVNSEIPMMDGFQRYILVNKDNGEMMEIVAS